MPESNYRCPARPAYMDQAEQAAKDAWDTYCMVCDDYPDNYRAQLCARATWQVAVNRYEVAARRWAREIAEMPCATF